MNTSRVVDLYTSLASLQVGLSDGTVPRAFGLAELPESITTAHIPCRLLLPVATMPGEGKEGAYIAIGNAMSITWQVTDLMLWQPSEQGLGLREYAPKLVEYSGKYFDAMRNWGRCPVQNMTLESVNITPGEYEWARGSGRFFAGVLCLLQIKEVLSG